MGLQLEMPFKTTPALAKQLLFSQLYIGRGYYLFFFNYYIGLKQT